MIIQLHIDWSIVGLGATFTQLDDDGQKFVVAYASSSNNKMEAKYNSYEGECLTIIWVVSSFWCYFYGGPFIWLLIISLWNSLWNQIDS